MLSSIRCGLKRTGFTGVPFAKGIQSRRFSSASFKKDGKNSNVATNDVVSSNFADWCKNHGVAVSKIRPFMMAGYGRGFKASDSIKKGKFLQAF